MPRPDPKKQEEAQRLAYEAQFAPPKESDPEQAALELVGYLPEEVQRLIKEAAGHWHVPIWQTMLGYAMRMHDIGELFVPYLLASWEVGKKPNTPRPCGSCGEMFISKYPDARYCCNPCACGKLEEFGHTRECPTREGVPA